MKDQILGYVENEVFTEIWPSQNKQKKLTTIKMVAGEDPLRQLVDLSSYNGSLIAVVGHNSEDFLYEAKIIEKAGSKVTKLVKLLVDTR
ncbi:hypothetical protein ACFFSY_18870 [Paenibacillus aurantiacus]|uniref:Uncharacterized protein n=1 Tax=Paenibacillus aurantiacus TaxID=1936118 RepID=A0ABV5KUU6_9BACL